MEEIVIGVRRDTDVVRVLQAVKRHAGSLDLPVQETALIATAAAELTSNIVKYAGHGLVTVRRVEANGRVGVEIEARDRGPGIADIKAALTDHHSTGGSLGLGLPGVKRLMDEMEIETSPVEGTTVTTRRWRRA